LQFRSDLRYFCKQHFSTGVVFCCFPAIGNPGEEWNIFFTAILFNALVTHSFAIDHHHKLTIQFLHGLHGYSQVVQAKRRRFRHKDHQVSAQGRLALQKATAAKDADDTGNTCEVWAEQEPGSAGKDVAAIFIKQLRGYPVFVQRPTGDKVTRAMPLAAQAEAGNVKLVRGPWNRAYIDELISFPNGKYKDQADGSSGAYNRLAAPGRPALLVDDLIASGDPEHAAEEHRPFSEAEIEQLPEFLRDLVKSTRETAAERNAPAEGW